MKTNTAQLILEFITTRRKASVKDLVAALGITQAAVHRQLNKLLAQQKIVRVGKPPTVLYLPAIYEIESHDKELNLPDISPAAAKIINNSYIYITPQGEILRGLEGFIDWWQTKNKHDNIENLIEEYLKTLKMFEVYRNSHGWINATEKVKDTFKNDVQLDELLFIDFYSYPKFGKTKLGQLILYGKQAEQITLIKEVVQEVKTIINQIISYYKIDAVGFIPPSLPRKIQFMDALKLQLMLETNYLDIRKGYVGPIPIAQKSLTSTKERIENARNTIHLIDTPRITSNILLIDDALGSGATLNETARKIKNSPNFKGKVIGCALAGSIKGFEVIKEI